jgi:putative PIN family toxin of toxin-antitoxin system
MVKVVIDTNVLVSATLFGGNPEKVLDPAEEGKIKILTSEEILEEFKGVLQRKFGFSLDMAEVTASAIKEISTLVTQPKD